MFRRTNCHYSLDRRHLNDTFDKYSRPMTALLEGEDDKVFLDVANPRVCLRGPEVSQQDDLGYAWLADTEVFPFYELRAAAVNMGGGYRKQFYEDELARRVRAQIKTLMAAGIRHVVLSAFGCGAFKNPAPQVATVYFAELQQHAAKFDVVVRYLQYSTLGTVLSTTMISRPCSGDGLRHLLQHRPHCHLLPLRSPHTAPHPTRTSKRMRRQMTAVPRSVNGRRSLTSRQHPRTSRQRC